MSQVKRGNDYVWMHEVCRIWTSGAASFASTNLTDSTGQCAICGLQDKAPNEEKCTVKCAAPGCQIHVHPMCALVSSIDAKSKKNSDYGASSTSSTEDDQNDARARDRFLCTQYTLSFAEVRGQTGTHGNDPGVLRSTTIPVLFCGIHNPKRESSFYGLYPGGEHLANGALIVPRCKEPAVNG